MVEGKKKYLKESIHQLKVGILLLLVLMVASHLELIYQIIRSFLFHYFKYTIFQHTVQLLDLSDSSPNS